MTEQTPEDEAPVVVHCERCGQPKVPDFSSSNNIPVLSCPTHGPTVIHNPMSAKGR
jgi:hypothetical protein